MCVEPFKYIYMILHVVWCHNVRLIKPLLCSLHTDIAWKLYSYAPSTPRLRRWLSVMLQKHRSSYQT